MEKPTNENHLIALNMTFSDKEGIWTHKCQVQSEIRKLQPNIPDDYRYKISQQNTIKLS